MTLLAARTGWLSRPGARSFRCPPPSTDARGFHASLPGYAPTPLVELVSLAERWNVGRVLVKNEGHRFGLRAFKALGASWAVARLVAARAGLPLGGLDLVGVRSAMAADPVTLVTATDGNHGRALARVGSWLGVPVEVVVPAVMDAGVAQAIEDEGARVTWVVGSYDDAVVAADLLARRLPGAVLVQDTAWPGYEEIPGWIVEGYQTMFAELDDQLAALDLGRPDLLAVPVGVGSLAQAAVGYAHRGDRRHQVRALSCEPDTAACVLASLQNGELVSVPTAATAMAGLNCGTPSSLAWPLLRDGLDAAVCVSDTDAEAAVAFLTRAGVPSGASGAAALAGAEAVLDDPVRRAALDLPDQAVVVLLNTEGPTGAGGVS